MQVAILIYARVHVDLLFILTPGGEEIHMALFLLMARPVARGCGDVTHHPTSPKRSAFSHKVDQKWGFCRRDEGGEVQKVHFWRVPHLPNFDPGYRPANGSYLTS